MAWNNKSKLQTLAFGTTCIEIGGYFLPFMVMITYIHFFIGISNLFESMGKRVPTGDGITFNSVSDSILTMVVGSIVLLVLILAFLGIELYGILAGNNCFIISGIVFRGIRFLLVDIVSLVPVVM